MLFSLVPIFLMVFKPEAGEIGESPTSRYQIPPQHELVALLAFCLSPVFMLLIGIVAGSGFAARFVTPGITAFAVAGAIGIACLARFPRVTGLCLLLPLASWFCLKEYGAFRTGLDRLRMEKPYHEDLRIDLSDFDPSGTLPVIDPYGERTILYSIYWSQEQVSRLSLITPAPASETRSFLSVLVPLTTTLNMQSYDEYTRHHRRFLVLGDKADWFFERARQDGATTRLLGRRGEYLVFEVTMASTDD